VTDTDNNRVLGYKNVSTYVNGGPADLVIGQSDFLSSACNTAGLGANSLCTPFGIAVDSSGNLYLADEGITEYSNTTHLSADAVRSVRWSGRQPVFGQGGSFTASDCNNGGLGASSLCTPVGVALDGGGNLYVADFFNSRVLEYNTPLTNRHDCRSSVRAGGSLLRGRATSAV